MTDRPPTPHEYGRQLHRRFLFRLAAEALIIAASVWVVWAHGGIRGRNSKLMAAGGAWATAVLVLEPPAWRQRPLIHWPLMVAPAVMATVLQAL